MFKNLLSRILPAQAAAAAPVAATAPTAPVSPPGPPDDVARADALIAEGDAREEAGELREAEALYRAAIAAAPGHARGHLYLGIVLASLNDPAGAAAAYERVLAIDPAHAFGNYNYARLALLKEDHAPAHAMLVRALQTKPEFPQALILQSQVLDALDRTQEAIDTLQAALRLTPEDVGAMFNLALLFQKAKRPDQAEQTLQRALALEPENLPVLELYFRVLHGQGFAAECLVPLREAVRLDPHSWPHRSMELMVMNLAGQDSAQELFQRHVAFGADLERAVPVRFDAWRERGDPGRRLRVGYLSADLVMHPVSMFMLPVLQHHDRSQVEVFCYSFAKTPDRMTEHLRAATDQWREVLDLSETELADMIHADGIDVLVDLMGHTGQPRLGVFAQRPAPVQVSWLGYLCTTGMTRMDFRLSDVRSDPPAIAQPWHTERLVHLPASQWCYRPMGEFAIDPVAPLERNGHVTFGCFNSALKVTPATCRRWAQVLLRVPGSRLLMIDVNSELKRDAVRREIESQGVAGDRLEFLPRVSLIEYMGLYSNIDIAFDTFPYGGGTTSFDSLWMGVPIVAAVGDLSVSRSAASILTALGLEDWVAPNVDGFVELAVARATDREGLLAVRRSLRGRMQDSLLMELPRYTRDLESAYRRMWLEKTA